MDGAAYNHELHAPSAASSVARRALEGAPPSFGNCSPAAHPQGIQKTSEDPKGPRESPWTGGGVFHNCREEGGIRNIRGMESRVRSGRRTQRRPVKSLTVDGTSRRGWNGRTTRMMDKMWPCMHAFKSIPKGRNERRLGFPDPPHLFSSWHSSAVTLLPRAAGGLPANPEQDRLLLIQSDFLFLLDILRLKRGTMFGVRSGCSDAT